MHILVYFGGALLDEPATIEMRRLQLNLGEDGAASRRGQVTGARSAVAGATHDR